MGNRELDVVVENDIRNATEIVLERWARVRPAGVAEAGAARPCRTAKGGDGSAESSRRRQLPCRRNAGAA
jgi:hypothetical protein